MVKSTVNPEEVKKFSSLANEWWDEGGKFRTLHQINPVRIGYIKNKIIPHFHIQDDYLPFKKLKILDVGCGGGLMSEPMSRLGGDVTGIDASAVNVKVAQMHAKQEKLDTKYIEMTIEKLASSKSKAFDVVLCLEIIEHVDNPEAFLSCCASLLKTGGIIFISTINRTVKSYLLAIVGAEYILRLMPIGTHDWNKFFKPSEISKMLRQNHIQPIDMQGMQYKPLKSKQWVLSDDLDVNYIMCGARKR